MKAILSFNLDDTGSALHERHHWELCVKAPMMHGLLAEVDEYARSRLAFGELNSMDRMEWEDFRRWLQDQLDDRRIPSID